MNETSVDDPLLDRMTAWAKGRRIHPEPGGFACPHYDSCNSACNGALSRERTVKMSYIGRYYGVPLPGRSTNVRLVMVGLDHGYFGPDRSAVLQLLRNPKAHTEPAEADRRYNLHYTGLIRQAATVLGGPFSVCRVECGRDDDADQGSAWQAKCQRRWEEYVLERFAHVNLVKCAPRRATGGSMQFVAPQQLQQNCAGHLAAELVELRPTLILLHGAPFREALTATRWSEFGWQVDIVLAQSAWTARNTFIGYARPLRHT